MAKAHGFTHIPTRDDGPLTRGLSGGKPLRQQAWCYLCNADHHYDRPCPELEAKRWYQREYRDG